VTERASLSSSMLFKDEAAEQGVEADEALHDWSFAA